MIGKKQHVLFLAFITIYNTSMSKGSAFIRKHKWLSGIRNSKMLVIIQTIYELLFRLFWRNKNIVEIQGSKMYVNVFDPEPRNYEFLTRNIQLNGYDNVVALQKAVADKPGMVKLFICPYDTGHHTIQKYDGIHAYRPEFVTKKKEFVEVEQLGLDDFLRGKTTRINVIKMDVEGAEMLALAGMEELIRENKNLIMLIEFFPLLIKEMGQSPEDFARRLLEDFHFKMVVFES